MHTDKTRHVLLLLACLLLALPLSAEEKKGRDIEFGADTVDYDDKNKRIRLLGNVIITSEGSTLSAPYAVYYTEKAYAEFVGGVKMVGSQSTATANTMKVWYGENRGRLEGAVRLVSQQGANGETQEPTVVLSELLDYDWVKEQGFASGGVKMRQGQKRAFADRAEIYQKRNEVLLIGNVRVEQGAGDWLTAERAVYDTSKQAVRAEGRVIAKTRLRQNEAKEDDSSAQSSAPAEAKAALPDPSLEEPAYELIPMRKLPSVPLPWLEKRLRTE